MFKKIYMKKCFKGICKILYLYICMSTKTRSECVDDDPNLLVTFFFLYFLPLFFNNSALCEIVFIYIFFCSLQKKKKHLNTIKGSVILDSKQATI